MPDRYGVTELDGPDDDDRDPYPPPWHAARPPARGTGPVVEAYVDTAALEVPCADGCGAQPGDWCHHPDGKPRRMPCPKRIRRATHHQATKGTTTA